MPAVLRSRDTSAQAPSGWQRWLRRLLLGCAVAYPLALLVLALAFYWVGESWWLTAAGLYAPRLPFALPLPFAIAVLWLTGLRRWLWTQLVAALAVVFPLMGFVLPVPSAHRTSGVAFRLLSFNVNSAYGGVEAIANKIFAESPDIVLLQEGPWGRQLPNALRARYPYVQTSTQFTIASRFQIAASTDPERLQFYGRNRSPRFMRYRIETPVGPIAVYSVHPISPRGVLHVHQFRAALHELRTGELFAGDPEADVKTNVGLRSFQIETLANQASHESLPVLIAGDTNLPGLSAVLRKQLSNGYTDAFRTASWGFGYTYPEKHPFLRLDRILATRELRFVSFKVDCQGVSDHLCVIADIQARR